MSPKFAFFVFLFAAYFSVTEYGCHRASARTNNSYKGKYTMFVHDTAQENGYKPLILHNPQTFEVCNVYKSADTNSEVLERLMPFTSFKHVEGVEIAIPDTIRAFGDIPEQYSTSTVVWAEVITLNGARGFVKPDKLARWTYENPSSKVRYLIGDYAKGKNRDWKTRFAKYDIVGRKVVSQIETDGISSEYQEYVNEIKNLPLKNVKGALRLYAHGDFCGGGDESIIMVDTPTGLTFLPIKSCFNDDGGGINDDVIYFPAINHNGQLKLYADADPGNKSTSGQTIAYPNNTKIPRNELIVEKTEDGEIAMNSDGEPVMTKGRKEKIESLSKTTMYYRWNGREAVKILEKKVKIK